MKYNYVNVETLVRLWLLRFEMWCAVYTEILIILTFDNCLILVYTANFKQIIPPDEARGNLLWRCQFQLSSIKKRKAVTRQDSCKSVA